jgi:hypothetical protein
MWFRVDDGFISHPKVTHATELLTGGKGDQKRGRGRIVAVWLEAGLHCSKYRTDGFVAMRELKDFLTDADPVAVMKACVGARLLTLEAGGFQYHKWLVYQPLAEPAKDQQTIDAKRKQLYRFKDLLTTVRNRDTGRCRRCGRIVNFKNRSGAEGGTYDFVDPQQSIGLANVFVCCQECLHSEDGPVGDADRLLPPGAPAESQNAIEGVVMSSQRLLPETCSGELAPDQVGASSKASPETCPSRVRDHTRDPVPSCPVPTDRTVQESSAPLAPRAMPAPGESHTPPWLRARLSIWQVRSHILASVHRLLEQGAPYVDADGQPVLSELMAEVKVIASRDLHAEWEGRELQSIVDAALGRRASMQEAEVAREGLSRRERRQWAGMSQRRIRGSSS